MNFTKTASTLFALALALVLSIPVAPQAHAADPFYTDQVVPLLPWRGVYYEPGRGGTGLTLDVDSNGFLFAAFYTYDAAGNQVYYLIEGAYQPTSEEIRQDTGVIGTMENPTIYTSTGGECVGAGCSYRAPTRTAANLNASFVWTTPQRLHMTIGGQSWDLIGGHFTVANTNLIQGQWSVAATFEVLDTPTTGDMGVIQSVVTTTDCGRWSASDFPVPAEGDPDYTENQLVLPSDAEICELRLDSGALRSHYNSVSVFLWISSAEGTAGMFYSRQVFSQWEPVTKLKTLYVDGQNTLRGRNVFRSGDVMGDVTMSRIVRGAVPYIPE